MARDGCVSMRPAMLLLAGLSMLASMASGTEHEALPTSRTEARLEQRTVPDIPLRLADGRQVMLSELGRGQNLLVTFFYRRCAGVCTPFLNWIKDATAAVGGLGSDYRILALSFDEQDSVAQLAAQARALGLTGHPDWDLAVTERGALDDITGALEFWYQRQPDSSQFDHGSLLVAVSDGRVRRALHGGLGETQRLRELIWELRGHVVPYYPIQAQPGLRCLSFDPVTGQQRMDWGMLLLVLPALASLAAALLLFRPQAAQRAT